MRRHPLLAPEGPPCVSYKNQRLLVYFVDNPALNKNINKVPCGGNAGQGYCKMHWVRMRQDMWVTWSRERQPYNVLIGNILLGLMQFLCRFSAGKFYWHWSPIWYWSRTIPAGFFESFQKDYSDFFFVSYNRVNSRANKEGILLPFLSVMLLVTNASTIALKHVKLTAVSEKIQQFWDHFALAIKN